jgi:hypothetical protein
MHAILYILSLDDLLAKTGVFSAANSSDCNTDAKN